MDWWTPHLPVELVSLALAFVLSSVIGLERQRRLKSAGLRTHTLVGLGAAVFTLVSAYGFGNVIGDEVVLDPSRIAAQVVSGVGFLGAGVIFVRRNAVNGLTTAASVWVSAAIGMACGAWMPVLAAAATALYLVAVTALTRVGRRLAPGGIGERVAIVQYREGRGALRSVLERSASSGFAATFESSREVEREGKQPRIEARIRYAANRRPLDRLVAELAEIKGVTSVRLDEEDD
jgi:putative Mg2+ transporter-C (MgtC) family protein